MTDTPIVVTQADRDAAADYADQHMATHVSWQKSAIEALRKGERDDHPLVQAFARHRITTEANHAEEVGRLREAFLETRELLGLLEQAVCDWSCPTKWRSDEPQPHSKLHEDLRAVLFKHEANAAAWNQRVPDPELIAAIREVVTMCEHTLNPLPVRSPFARHLRQIMVRLDTILGGSDAD
jgi:hypothetical protein